MTEKRTSMADVARLAGVSAQTVSRVVNDSPRVDASTRARVEDALARSGYRVHRAARALRTGRSGTIGAIVSTLATVGNSLMLEAVSDAAASQHHDVALVTLGDDGVGAAFERLRAQGVDGIIVINEASAFARSASLPDDIRVVIVDSAPDGRRIGVETDHAGGARLAVQHLLDLGHRTVSHIAGPESSYAAVQRERGWRGVLADAARPAGDLVRGAWTSDSGYDAARSLLRLDGVGTAVFVANDQMALGALDAFAEAGLRVPEDVSVVGFDDVADAVHYQPPLTTVRQHFDRLGRAAVGALIDPEWSDTRRIGDGSVSSRHLVIPATLVVRRSTAAPAAW